MFFKTLRDLARPQVVAIFDVLKRSDGLAVGDIAEALGMSYMGVKQYCLELEKRGYLDTWRRAKATGRPELTYRLTGKAQLLFPQQSTELSMEILEAVRQLHGPTAAEKILYQYFLKVGEGYAKKLKGQSLADRASSLARLRESEGHCAQVDHDARHGLRLTEFHSPLAELMKAYPSAARMEESMLSRLLQVPVRRETSAVSGLMRITFLLAGATLPPPAPVAAAARPRQPVKRGERTGRAAAPSAAKTSSDRGESPARPAEETEASGDTTPGTPRPAEPAELEPAVPAAPEITVDTVCVEPSEAAGDPVHVEATAPVTPADASRVNETPMLFAAQDVAPAPRLSMRVAPARSVSKPAATVVEELFLSL